jgi:DNA replication protein DnaC
VAHPAGQSARALDAGDVSFRPPTGRQPQTDSRVCRTGVHRQAENIVLHGDTGRGKTGLASGLLLKALANGYRCQFARAQDLFDEMYASLADRSTRRPLNRLARLDLLLID